VEKEIEREPADPGSSGKWPSKRCWSMVAYLEKSAVPEPSTKFNGNVISGTQFTNVTREVVASHVILPFIFLLTILPATKLTLTNSTVTCHD